MGVSEGNFICKRKKGELRRKFDDWLGTDHQDLESAFLLCGRVCDKGAM